MAQCLDKKYILFYYSEVYIVYTNIFFVQCRKCCVKDNEDNYSLKYDWL